MERAEYFKLLETGNPEAIATQMLGPGFANSVGSRKLPWKSADDFLEDIVHKMEQTWGGGRHNELRAAFKPYVGKIFQYLQSEGYPE